EFPRAYLDNEQVRFRDRLKVTFEMEPLTLSAQVPHLILQPVVENAIQHAVAPRTAQSHIDIKAQRLAGLLRLEVKDNGPGIASKSDLLELRGVGLNNVRARLNQVYVAALQSQLTNGAEGGLTVTMEIPFRCDVDR